MKATDYIVRFLIDRGVKDIFGYCVIQIHQSVIQINQSVIQNYKTLNISVYFCCFFLISCLNSLGEQPKLFLQYLLKPAAEVKPNSYATSFIEMKS